MHMTKKLALLDYNKCQPEKCENGVCVAAQACPSKLLKQDTPYTVPLPEPFACRACGDCTRACPQQAIRIVSS
jgi:translation initiation factor RLI1